MTIDSLSHVFIYLKRLFFFMHRISYKNYMYFLHKMQEQK